MLLKANFSLSIFRGNLHCGAGRGFALKTKWWNKSSQWKSFPLRPYALPAPLIQITMYRSFFHHPKCWDNDGINTQVEVRPTAKNLCRYSVIIDFTTFASQRLVHDKFQKGNLLLRGIKSWAFKYQLDLMGDCFLKGRRSFVLLIFHQVAFFCRVVKCW